MGQLTVPPNIMDVRTDLVWLKTGGGEQLPPAPSLATLLIPTKGLCSKRQYPSLFS